MKSAKILILFTFLSAFAVCVAAQSAKTPKKLDSIDLIKLSNQSENPESSFVTPNELRGYEFFKQGKLNKIRLGYSAKEDIQKIFGSDCKKSCDYNSEWTISVHYIDKSFVLVSQTPDKSLNTVTEKQYVPKEEAIGKVDWITFQSKKKISFSKIVFPDKFSKSSYLETGYLMPDYNDGLGITFDYYTDSYGLQYIIFDKIVNDKLKDTFNLKRKFNGFQKGDLISIKYEIPEEMESRFFVEVE